MDPSEGIPKNAHRVSERDPMLPLVRGVLLRIPGELHVGSLRGVGLSHLTDALEPRDPQGDSTKSRHSRRGERRLEALSYAAV